MDDRHLEHEPALVRRAPALLGRRPHLVHVEPGALSPGRRAAVRESGLDGVALRRPANGSHGDGATPANRLTADRPRHHRGVYAGGPASGLVANRIRHGAHSRRGGPAAVAPTHQAVAGPRVALVGGATASTPRLCPDALDSVAALRDGVPTARDWVVGRYRGGRLVGLLYHGLYGELSRRSHRRLRARRLARPRSGL